MTQSEPRPTPLTPWHEAAGARLAEFAGFRMPIQYESVLAEHAAVRSRVGLFDVSHMGEIAIRGEAAEAWLDGLVTNRVAGIPAGKVVYTAMCRENGGVLDDMLVYRLAGARWLVVCNAANREKIVAWLHGRRPATGVEVADVSDATALIAVQGPESRELLHAAPRLAAVRSRIDELEFYTAFATELNGEEWFVSRTGYTGEHGYEIYLPNAAATALWRELLDRGRDLGAVPVGLAARDTLRFEVGYCLYGHELDEETSPLEAGIGWAVKLKKSDFVGRAALLDQKEAGVPRRLIGLEVQGRAIARHGAEVYAGEARIGRVTSGTFSPTLQRSLAMALVASGMSSADLEVEVRGRRIPVRERPLPFLAARVKGDPRADRTLPAAGG
jgi:aminomethyltransferase